jgi:hypothetical protein
MSVIEAIQADLFADVKGIRQRFEEFHLTHPQVYLMFERFALALINKGHKKLGAKMIIERIRWEITFEQKPEDERGFKINNDFVAHYARMFIKNHPQYKDYFEFRIIKSL